MLKKLLGLVLATAAALAGAAPTIDPSVTFAEVLRPHRVVVWNVGFEHVSSGAVAEWIAEGDDATGSARVVHSARLVEPGWFRLGRPTLTKVGDRTRVRFVGTHTYSGETVSCVFDLSAAKAVSVVRACR